MLILIDQALSHAGKDPKLACPCTRYTIDIMIRWTDLGLEKTNDNHHQGKISIGMMAYDRDGDAENWGGAIQGMNLDPDVFAAIQKSGVPAHMEIDLPNTDVFLETGVYDWNTGKAGTLEIPLHSGLPTGTAASLPQRRLN
jgi:hypothetical protein